MNYINKLQNDLMEEKEHSSFLEELLKTLIGDGWDRLTLYDAKRLHNLYASHPSNEEGEKRWFCENCGLYFENNIEKCFKCGHSRR